MTVDELLSKLHQCEPNQVVLLDIAGREFQIKTVKVRQPEFVFLDSHVVLSTTTYTDGELVE